MVEYEEIQSSKFNAGILGTQRVNEILVLLNQCKMNPLAWNLEQSDWNYNLILRCIENLYGEVEGFLNDKETQKAIDINLKIKELMEEYPIKDNIKKPNLYNQKSYEILMKAFGYYERIIKRYGTKYKLLVSFEKRAGRI